MQENYNTGSEGAESQMRDGRWSNLEIDNRKSPPPPLPNEDAQGGTIFLCREYKHCYRGRKKGKKKVKYLIWLGKDKYNVIHLPLSPSLPKCTENPVKIAIFE